MMLKRAFLASAVLLTPVAVYAQGTYSIDDLMTVTSVQQFEWAPDGRWIYFTSTASTTGVAEIFRVPASGGTPTQLTNNLEPAFTVTPVAKRAEPKRDMVVSPDGKRIFFTSARYFQNIDNIYSIAADGSDVRQHTWHDAIIETAPAISPDGRTLAYFDRRGRGTKVRLIDLTVPNAWPRELAPGNVTERHPVWSPDGKTLIVTRNGELYLLPVAGGDARRLVEPGYSVGNPVWSPDGRRVAVTSSESGFSQIGLVDVATGKLTPVTYAARNHSDPSWSPDGKTLVITVTDGLGLSTQIATIDVDGDKQVRVLTSGRAVRRSPAFSPNGREIAFIETTTARAPDIWAIPATGGTARQITNSMGRVDPKRLSEAEEITYPAVDNLPIPALLYKPPGYDPNKKYPAVVALHGHPGQWNHSFSNYWQHFLQLGFVVIAPNPRGSINLGAGYHDLHVGDYGGTEFEDVMGAVEYLRKLGNIDMNRLATEGGSGGGYMQFVIATKAPKVFKAQIIRAPVSNWKWLAMERYVSPARFATPTREPQRAREEMGGAYTDIPERYDERSPLNFVENVVTHQLLLQGMRDSSVPPNESRRWVERMRELGKGDLIEYVEYPDEDHSLNRYRATVRDRMTRNQAFLAKHVGLGPAGTRASN